MPTTVWGNRYSALVQASTTHQPYPEPDLESDNQRPPAPYKSKHQMPQKPRYPPNSSVFVASLPFGVQPEEAQAKLSEKVSEIIKPVSIKIIDDKLGNKAAFVQAKTAEDAEKLLNSTLSFDGKSLRLELAHAHRSILLSFKTARGLPTSLRLVRNRERFIQILLNDATTTIAPTTEDAADPFSGNGHLMKPLSHTSEGMKQLCELFGPLESFTRRDYSEIRENHPAHVLLAKDSEAEPGVWEAKWQFRDDAMEAKNIFHTLYHICWDWAHNKRPEYSQATIGRPLRRSFYDESSKDGGPTPFFHRKQDLIRHSAQSHDNTSHEATTETILPISHEIRSYKKQDSHPTHPPEMSLEEFPPLSAKDLDSVDYENKGKPGSNPHHNRSLSEDPVSPITPIAMDFGSPNVVLPRDTIPEPHESGFPKAEELPNEVPELPFKDRQPQFDTSALYLSGIPLSVGEDAINDVLKPYGQVQNISIIRGKGPLNSAFASFVQPRVASIVLQASENNHGIFLGGYRIRLRYKRNFSSNRGRGGKRRFPGYSGGNFGRQRYYNHPNEEQNPEAITTVDSIINSDKASIPLSKIEEPTGLPSPLESTDSTATAEGDPRHAGSAAVEVAFTNEHHMEAYNEQTPVPNEEDSDTKRNTVVPTPVTWMDPAPNKPVPLVYQQPYYPPLPWTGYPPHWGYPYPMYPPMYSMQPYGQQYWPYPQHVPMAPFSAPSVPPTVQPMMDGTPLPSYSRTPSEVAMSKAPVVPMGFHQTPDGVNYLYPPDVIQQYMGTRHANGNQEIHNKAGNAADVVDHHGAYNYSQAHHYNYLGDTALPEVHPSVAVYSHYPPLPPPADVPAKGTYVFNQKGIVQRVESVHVPVATATSGGRSEELGMGMVQAAVAVVASGQHDTPPHMLQGGPALFPGQMPPERPYYYPQGPGQQAVPQLANHYPYMHGGPTHKNRRSKGQASREG